MDEFIYSNIFTYFSKCSFSWFEEILILELYPSIKENIEKFTRPGYKSWTRYDKGDIDTNTVLNVAQKVDKIVELLNSNEDKRENFQRNFPTWEKQRKRNIQKLQQIVESMQGVRKSSNIVKILSGSVGLGGALATVGSLLFPPAAPALLPAWLGGATAAALLPSVFCGAPPVVSALGIAGGVAAAGGGTVNVLTIFGEQMLNDRRLNEAKEVIAEDRKLLQQMEVSEFLDELNRAIDDLFGKNTSSNILNDLIDFLEKVRSVFDPIQPVFQTALRLCLSSILPKITKFLLVGTSLASVVLSIFFVVFMTRRRGCVILKHRLALGLLSAVDAGVEVTRLIAAAGLRGSKFAELIPRQMAGKIAVGAIAGVSIVLDVATIVISSIDLAQGSLSEEVSMISEIGTKLKDHLLLYQKVYNEIQTEERCN